MSWASSMIRRPLCNALVPPAGLRSGRVPAQTPGPLGSIPGNGGLTLRVGCVGEFHEITGDDECHLLADVHGVIADALDLARDDMHADAPFEEGLVGGGVENLRKHAPLHPTESCVHT